VIGRENEVPFLRKSLHTRFTRFYNAILLCCPLKDLQRLDAALPGKVANAFFHPALNSRTFSSVFLGIQTPDAAPT